MEKIELDQIICHDVTKPFPLPDECIDMVISSPPYWGLRDYGKDVKSIFGGDPNCEHEWIDNTYIRNTDKTAGKKQKTNRGSVGRDKPVENNFCSKCNAWQGQLGLEPHPQMFIDHLVSICREVKRVLKKSGSMYINLGDTYSSKPVGSFTGGGKEFTGRNMAGIATSGSIDKTKSGIPQKCLCLIPSRVAIALVDDGWILRNDIIWHKINSMPSSVKDRLNTTYEHVFHFVRSRKYYYDLDAIREPHTKTSLDRAKYDFNVIPRAWRQETMAIPRSGGKAVNIDCHPAGKNPGDILEYDSKYKNGSCSQTPQGLTRVQSIAKERVQSRKDAKRLFPNDPKKQQEYINYIHDHGGHPMGPNPGDVIKQGMHHGSSLSNKATHYEKAIVKLDPNGANPGDVLKSWGADKNLEYRGDGKHNPKGQSPSDLKRSIIESFKDNPKGKNPGDFWKTNPEYIVGKLAEKIRDFQDAHPDADLGWLDDIIKDIACADLSSDFWSLTTQPFTGYNPDLEHFAVFPEDLVIKPLKASCPKEICKKCGKPRTRLTKTSYKKRWNRSTKEKHGNDGKKIDGYIRPNMGDFEGLKQVETVGWSDCGCNVGFDAGVVLDPFCYDEDTEVLTKDGWKSFRDIKYTTEMATLNPKNDELEYHLPTRIIKLLWNGEMYHICSNQVDLKVTSNHSLYVAKRKALLPKAKWEYNFYLPSEIFGKFVIYKKNCKWEGKNKNYFTLPSVKKRTNKHGIITQEKKKLPIKEWLKFFGFWLAEGSTLKGKDYRIQVTQKDLRVLKDIQEILNVLEFKSKIYTNTDANGKNDLRICNKQLYDYLRQFGRSSEKFIPMNLKELDSQLLKILLEYYLKGDGSKDRNCAWTTSMRLRDDIIEIILKCGWSASYRVKKSERRVIKGKSYITKDCYIIYINKCQNHPKVYSHLWKNNSKNFERWEQYNGNVYCVEVPNHIIYVRRGGKPVWSGNCGRGTVGKVAKQLGLHYILFDIKPEYCELARLYIGGQKHKLHRDQSKLDDVLK